MDTRSAFLIFDVFLQTSTRFEFLIAISTGILDFVVFSFDMVSQTLGAYMNEFAHSGNLQIHFLCLCFARIWMSNVDLCEY